jgi:hypothetical protein
MAELGIQYKYPWIYGLSIKIIHRGPVLKEFKKQVGEHVSVFDVAAGFGNMAHFIDDSNTYSGIDLNQTYVEYAQRHGLNVQIGDIFDGRAYRPHEVTMLVDVVHHMPEGTLKILFDNVFKNTRKRVVILEPAFLNLEERYGRVARPIDWALRKLDGDGVNTIERWYSEKEYLDLFETKFSSVQGRPFTVHVLKIYPYFIVTYTRA